MSDLIDSASHDGIRRITLNRPEKVNALNIRMMRDLADAIRSADPARERLVVLAGNGAKGFCAGADLRELEAGGDRVVAQCDGLLALVEALAACAVPSLCLVHGRTLGGGGMIAALSTIVLAEADTQIGFPEIRLGMFPAIVHAALLERLPEVLAFQLCASGRLLDAKEAQAIGLVTEMLAPGAREERIAFYANRAAAIACGRRAARLDPSPPVAERVRRAIPLFLESFAQMEANTRATNGSPSAAPKERSRHGE